ncbi:MAG: hypothetical protein U1E81_03030 [Xanthobacteraceae bacterium]
MNTAPNSIAFSCIFSGNNDFYSVFACHLQLQLVATIPISLPIPHELCAAQYTSEIGKNPRRSDVAAPVMLNRRASAGCSAKHRFRKNRARRLWAIAGEVRTGSPERMQPTQREPERIPSQFERVI